MALLLKDMVRTLVVAWLLLTLPVVCHNQTAVMLLSALGAGHGEYHGMAQAASYHAAHVPGRGVGEAGFDAHAAPQPARPLAPAWCAEHPAQGKSILPAGQDSLAAAAALPLPMPHVVERTGTPLDYAVPSSSDLSPPTPPPRFTA